MWLKYFILGWFGLVVAENQIQKLREFNERNDCDVDCEAESVACIENCDITDQECVRNCLSLVFNTSSWDASLLDTGAFLLKTNAKR